MAKKILVIEDDNILQEAIKESLIEYGFQVLQAYNGEEGLKKAELENPDLILLDLILPKVDGYHLLCDLRKNEKLKDVPILVLTVVDSGTSVTECMASGATGYLVKSKYSLEDIVGKVREHLGLE